MRIPQSTQFAQSCATRYRCILLVAIAVALMGSPAGAMPYMPAKWVQLRVSEEHGVEVVHVRNVDKLVNPERDHHHRQNKFLLLDQADPNVTRFHPEPEGFDVYYELDGTEYHVHTATDPRWVIHEWLDDNGAVTGKRVKKSAGHFTVTIPRSATHVRVVPTEVRLEGRSAKVHTLHVPHDTDGEHGTKFAVKQVPDYVADLPQLDSKTAKPILSIIQTVGLMEEHKNIVFLSSGYTEAEQSKFDNEVGKLVDLMQGTIVDNEGRSAEPYHRYFSLLNIFAVFVADPQSGVHHPMAGGSVPQSVKPNYLDCSYGKTNERFLQCSDEKVKWLGSYAPPREENAVYAVLVNDELYGGTGGSRVCQFSHKANALLGLYIHEMGHADGGLLDEYDYGVTEPSQPKGLENCHWEETNPPWQKWIDLGKVGKPAPVCAYSNFYKPTNQTCQMFSNVLHTDFCPVCQEQQAIRIFGDSKDLTSPRCPVNHEWLYVEVGKDATVYMNHRYLSQRQVYGSAYLETDLAKRYRVFNSTSTAFVTVPAADLQMGSNRLVVEIRDEIDWVLPEHRVSAMLFRAEFLIKVVTQLDTSGCQMKDCNIWRSQYLPYCAVCQTNRTCNVTYEAAPFELQGAGNFVAQVQSFFATMAIVIGVGIAFFFVVVCGLGRLCKNEKAQIVRQAIWIKYMRNIMLFSSVVIMVSSVIALGYGVYLFSVNDVFGKAFDLILMGFSAIVYVVAFIGFIAALFRSKVLLIINGILLVWLFAAACFCTFEIFAIGGSITDPKWSNTIGKYWLSFTLSNPSDMCTLQFQLKCSGFTASCSTSSLSAYCPVNCDRSNKFAEPCYGFFTKIITNNFATIGGLGIGMCVFLGFALIFNWVYCCTIERKDKARARYKARKAGLQTHEDMPPAEMQAKLIDEEPGHVPFA